MKEKEGDIGKRCKGCGGSWQRGKHLPARRKTQCADKNERGPTKMVATKMMAILFVWPVFVCPNL